MTVLLVLFTLVIFLTIDHFLEKRKAGLAPAADATPARASLSFPFPIRVPDGVSLATNHTWLKPNADGTVTIGFDALLSRLLGTLDRIAFPKEGEVIVPAAATITAASKGHSLHIAPAAIGQVVQLNHEALKNPSLILNEPYGKGWLMRVKPRAEDVAATKHFLVDRPTEWLKEQAMLIRDFISINSQQLQPVVLQEGGLPVEGVLQQFDEKVWGEFNQRFAALHHTTDTESKEN
jgi:glycine cleavage system H protein